MTTDLPPTVFPSWWLRPGDLISCRDGTTRVGVVMEVKEPGVIRIRWGTDTRTGWYDMNDFYKVKVVHQ
jgi:hypothetical protein